MLKEESSSLPRLRGSSSTLLNCNSVIMPLQLRSSTIAEKYRVLNKWLPCRYRRFDSIAQLKNAGITLAPVKDAFLRDHCLAVLEVSDQTMVKADPVSGKKSISHEQFEKIRRFSGIVLNRDSTHSI